MANTLVFVDFPSPDPAATQSFYEAVFEWSVEGRPRGDFHRIVPGEGLHLGIFNERTQTPSPAPDPTLRRARSLHPRTYILVDREPSIYLETVRKLGGEILWEEQYWAEFDGWHASFRDPWGNQIVLWYKGKPGPQP